MPSLFMKFIAVGMVFAATIQAKNSMEVFAIFFVGGNLLMILSLILDELQSRKHDV